MRLVGPVGAELDDDGDELTPRGGDAERRGPRMDVVGRTRSAGR